MSEQRESMEFDVVIVGAGPAGVSAAIRLKQLAQAASREISVCVIEKGAEVGAHILSGAVIDPIALNELIPDWKARGAPVETEVADDRFYYLTATSGIRIPNLLMPPLMSNRGNYIISLGQLCRWLAREAEALGVEIYPGFAAVDVELSEKDEVTGIVTGDMGVARDGHRKANYAPGMVLKSKYTLIAEGARGSLAKKLIARFKLNATSTPQTFGLGIKELWEIPKGSHRPGLVMHSMGWPLTNHTGGGSFVYHYGDRLVAVGFVVHLDYRNPYLSPFDEFQRFKTHKMIRPMLEGGRRIAYGARAITEGGLQAVPKLVFKGGALIGCAAGFVNVPRIKGSHNAMKTGMLAAQSVFKALQEDRAHDELGDYETAYRTSWVYKDLQRVRNVKPLWSRFGTLLGVPLSGFDMWANQLLGFSPFGTLRNMTPDFAQLQLAARATPIAYPRPDGVVSFDKLSSVFLSGTRHDEDEPVHLKLTDPALPIATNLPVYAEPAQRYCPAGVFEVVHGNQPRFVINASNCVHCKTCDIKDPAQNITWVPPEGGDGPAYGAM
ncbi:MAG TPA: electron transfer flavoprotein-ubiquinone oxidoreductase [Micropepsaceae bacterium]|nr:electron transfer flavoprotein-ubiquinone oxidoreductase [Micropepsaceae bacterium]